MKMEQVYGELELAKSEVERLKSTLTEKESVIACLRCANSRLKNGSVSELRKLEDENIQLLKALEDADEKRKGQERAIGVVEAELENIRVMLSASQRKCSEAEQEARELREESRKKDGFLSLEEVKRKLEDQLKWKKEQFQLLEQAHAKLRGQFETSKGEWAAEKASLLDEISTMQSNLESQASRTESLKRQLDRCKDALSHEGSRRQNLESRVAEMQTRLDSISDECWQAKSRACTSAVERDDQVSVLRDSVRELESELKEAEYKARKLEKENQDLLSSLRELQEAHIPKTISTPPSAVAKIKSKLRSLEQAHKDCSVNLRSKEADWNSQIQMMKRDLDEHKFRLKLKEASVKDLKKDLEDANAANTELKLQNEELSLMLQLLRAEHSETQSMTRPVVQRVEQDDEREEEIKKYKEMLDESYREQVSLKQELQQVCGALERLSCELADKMCGESEIEFELHIWRSSAERLEAQLEENQRLRRELETSLLAQAGFEEHLKLEICSLKQQLGVPQFEENDDEWPKQEEETAHKEILHNTVGKGREIRASDERSPFREIN